MNGYDCIVVKLDFILIDTYNLQYIDDTLTKTNTGKYVIQSNSI